MPRTHKTLAKQNLSKLPVLIEDTGVESTYFNIKQLPGVLTGGRNGFLITGTSFLKPGTEVLVELLDVNGNSIYVDAVAGSGKTTVCIFIAKKNKHKNILQVTYNKHLKNEVREKVKVSGVEANLEINTYHSLGVKFYDESAKTDDGIIKILEQNKLPKKI